MDEFAVAEDQPVAADKLNSGEEISRFVDSYASFNRIINSLQRKYIGLKQEVVSRNALLAEANEKLTELNQRNLVVTEFLDGILNSITAGVIAVNRVGRITHFNRAASRILGIPVDEPLGKFYHDIVPASSPPENDAPSSALSARAIAAVEKQIDLVDGTKLLLSVSTAVLRDAKGTPTGAVEVFHDLTRIKKMEQELARLNTLAALGEMAATVAHEVRNPLSGIGGFAALLKKDMDHDDPKLRLVDNIIRGVDSLNETVTTLLNYTRFEETNRSQVDVPKFVQDAIDRFQQDNSSRLDNISITSLCEECRVHIDITLVRQVLYNLFSNSIEAQPDGGEIIVSARVLPRQMAAKQYSERLLLGIDETVVEINVEDFGGGVKEADMDKLFAPFFTTRSEGNGLGLAVALKVMKAHSGDIVVQNKAGGGVIFRLLLPTRIVNENMEPS